MPSTTDKKISSQGLLGPASTSLFSAKGKGPVGANAPIILQNKKGVAINARKITSLKNISQSQSKRISGDTVGDKLPGGGGLGKTLSDIADNMDSIKNTIIEQQRVDKRSAEDERKAAEKAARGKQEKDLESKFTGLKQTASKVLAPVKSLWEKLLNFITTIFLGKAAIKLFEWFADKENAGKIEAIGKFLRDWWPALLAAYLLFGNAFTSFAAGLVFKLGAWAVKLTGTLLKQLLGAAAKLGGGGLAGFGKTAMLGGIAVGATLLYGRMTDDTDLGSNDVGNRPVPGQQQEMSGGGTVRGSGNKDTVPAMLTPGEFVMSAPAVQKWGVDTFEGMNAAGGGTNKPKQDGGVTYPAGGGWIGGIKKAVGNLFGGGKEQSTQKYDAILDLIGKRESDSSGGYDAVNQFGTDGGHGVGDGYAGPFSQMPQHGGKKLTSLTVGDVMKLQSGWAGPMSNEEWKQKGKLHAVGRYQIIGPTLSGLVGRGVVNEGDKFNEETQNKLAIALIKGRGHDPRALQSEWIGLSHESIEDISKALEGGGAVKQMSTSSRGSSANVSAPPPVTSVNPPVKPSSTVAYGQQKNKGGQPPISKGGGTATLPDFDPAMMNSMAKIKTLGITV